MSHKSILVSGVVQYSVPIIELAKKKTKLNVNGIISEAKKKCSLSFVEKYLKNYIDVLQKLGICVNKRIIEVGFLYFYMDPNKFETYDAELEAQIKEFVGHTLIALDPITYGLLSLKKHVLDKYNLKVVSVIDVILDKLRSTDVKKFKESVTLHEPCWYTRWNDKSKELNEIMEIVCAKYVKAPYSGKLSMCCGALLALTKPELAIPAGKEVLKIFEICKADFIVTVCPIGYVFFKEIAESKEKIIDLAELLMKIL